jgi:hypothetical protein
MAEEFTRCCYGATLARACGPGTARRAAPVGRVHLGWLGKLRRVERLHGAIGSGRRAAAGILADTQLSTPGAGQRTTASAAALSITATQPLTA